jgi:hypothetical protein
VSVNDFEGINTALSLGIGYNHDWDVAIAERGIVVHQLIIPLTSRRTCIKVASLPRRRSFLETMVCRT